MKKAIIMSVCAVLLFVVLIKVWPILTHFVISPHKGEKVDSWHTRNASFQLRVDAFAEANGGFVPGAYYTFLSAPRDSERWNEVMTFRHDDPLDIRRNQVHFVNDNVGYLFMNWTCASTSNGGKNWAVWDSCKKTETLKIRNYEGIKAVYYIAENGTGIMIVNPVPEQNPFPTLHTEDFGCTWHE